MYFNICFNFDIVLKNVDLNNYVNNRYTPANSLSQAPRLSGSLN